MKATKQRIAVIGSGISGLASAYFLNRQHDVVLFEAGDYLGGHTNTVDVCVEGMTQPVDTGFLVFNQATYPNLIALFAELGVSTYATDMSFSVSLNQGAFEWAGTNLNTVFAQRRHLLSPSFLGMLRDILRFNAAAQDNLTSSLHNKDTLGQLLSKGAYGARFRDAYLLPMAAAIWSSSPKDILNFPASTFLRFCLNHGLLQVNNRPKWQTVAGGGREYVQRIAATLADVRLSTPVLRVERQVDGVMVHTNEGGSMFDAVVFANHAPDTLALLADASVDETELLSAVRYQANTAILHTDVRQLPQRQKVWSAWNYLGGAQDDGQRAVCVSYWLNQLQRLPFKTPLVLTLNPFTPPAPEHILAQFEYQHPIFDAAAVAAQAQLSRIQGQNRTWFAGAWTGYGFHEDGLKSALRVVSDFGLAPNWASLP
ncbi:NAD(P)/FAD-dependent oxidoreductase [Hydromonas duriensis]|uniref:Putative NAD/FAD-binding protein n=1 Tax=Hydromonas duriensis TaxID=1527608 RepID=A0A4R6Y481_9BURK|nr:FAD-dependent oxidoreductase [Hydromonas duriensis]TDR27835.1 putative NAD/FAD-binding protein [Hydromonas duriensis]